MRRSLETEQPLELNAPLRNSPPTVADDVAVRELNTPHAQAQQNASLATRNPNVLAGAIQQTQESLARAETQAAQREQEGRRLRALDTAFNGDGGPNQWFADAFETFAIALASGMGTADALRRAVRSSRPEVQTLFAQVADQVEQGATLTQALQAHQERLPDVVVPIFQHGTLYGTEERAARQLARALKHLASVEAKFAYSALNPGMWMPLVAGGVLILALLPLFLIFSNPLIPFMLLGGLLLGGSAAGWKFRYKLMQRRQRFAWLSQSALNGVGKGFVRRQTGGARWSRTFAALWHCGVPISSALEAAGRSTRNAYYESVLRQAAQDTRNGVSLGDSLARVGLLKGEMLETIRTGETSGELGPLLDNWADVLEDDAKQRGAQTLFASAIGLLFAGALLVCVLALTFAYFYSARPLPLD